MVIRAHILLNRVNGVSMREMSDITWIQEFQMLLQVFRSKLSDNIELSDDKVDELVDTIMSTLPALLKTQLQAA